MELKHLTVLLWVVSSLYSRVAANPTDEYDDGQGTNDQQSSENYDDAEQEQEEKITPEQKLSEAMREIEGLTIRIEKMSKNTEDMKKKLDAKISVLEEEIKTKTTENEQITSNLGLEIKELQVRLHKESNDTKYMKNKMEDNIADLEKNLDNMTNEYQQNSDKLKVLVSTKSNLEEEKIDLLKTQTELMSNLFRLETERADLAQRLVNSTAQNEIFDTSLNRIEKGWQKFCQEKKKKNTEDALKTVAMYSSLYNLVDQNYTELMESACNNNDTEVVVALLDLGMDIDAPVGPNQVSCLHASALRNYVELEQALIERGANIEAKDSQGWTPLMWTAYKGSLEVAKLLVDSGANLSARSNTNRTVLIYATKYNMTQLVDYLKAKGDPGRTANTHETINNTEY